jgi:homoserine O-succinyltransferase
MPIRLPSKFPAGKRLRQERIETMDFDRASSQEIRPLKVVLFNLMPTKIDTEVQLLRLMSRSSIQIEPVFLRTATYKPSHDSMHLDSFYVEFDDIKDQQFDAIIITGAPVEQLKFDDVQYFDEFVKIVKWSESNVFAKLFICWGAQAGLYVDFDVEKQLLEQKIFGVYPHKVAKSARGHHLTRGFDDIIYIPQSRHSGLNARQVQEKIDCGELMSLIESSALGFNVLATPDSRKVYVLGHFEYDRNTLKNEYVRDLERGMSLDVPKNYFPGDDPKLAPNVTWRSHANLFFVNWINFIYQETPYDLRELL